MFGVFKTSSRGLFRGDPVEKRDKLAGWFEQEDFANAFVAALHREQMEKVGTVLDEYEVRPTTFETLLRYWKAGRQ